MKKKKKKKVIIYPLIPLAWDKLQKQMDKMNLSPTEQDLIKKEIQHKEAELLRISYF